MAAKEGTSVEHEGASHHHYDSAKSAIQQTTKEPPHYPQVSTSHLQQRRRESELQVGNPTVVKEGLSLHQQFEEPPSPGPEILAPQDRQSSRYCLPEMQYGEETVEHVMVECP